MTLSVDRKLLGDPQALYFAVAVASEGTDAYDMRPDEEEGPGEYLLAGQGPAATGAPPAAAAWPRCP